MGIPTVSIKDIYDMIRSNYSDLVSLMGAAVVDNDDGNDDGVDKMKPIKEKEENKENGMFYKFDTLRKNQIIKFQRRIQSVGLRMDPQLAMVVNGNEDYMEDSSDHDNNEDDDDDDVDNKRRKKCSMY